MPESQAATALGFTRTPSEDDPRRDVIHRPVAVRDAIAPASELGGSDRSLFAPPNFTSAVILTLCALAVGGAIGMLLELEKGFGGFIHNSPQPMLQAVKALEAQPKE